MNKILLGALVLAVGAVACDKAAEDSSATIKLDKDQKIVAPSMAQGTKKIVAPSMEQGTKKIVAPSMAVAH